MQPELNVGAAQNCSNPESGPSLTGKAALPLTQEGSSTLHHPPSWRSGSDQNDLPSCAPGGRRAEDRPQARCPWY